MNSGKDVRKTATTCIRIRGSIKTRSEMRFSVLKLLFWAALLECLSYDTDPSDSDVNIKII